MERELKVLIIHENYENLVYQPMSKVIPEGLLKYQSNVVCYICSSEIFYNLKYTIFWDVIYISDINFKDENDLLSKISKIFAKVNSQGDLYIDISKHSQIFQKIKLNLYSELSKYETKNNEIFIMIKNNIMRIYLKNTNQDINFSTAASIGILGTSSLILSALIGTKALGK